MDENARVDIFNASSLKIVGKVNALDMYALETKCTSGWDLLDMGDATFVDKLEVGPFQNGNPSYHTFIPNTATKIKCTSFVTPKFEGITELPAYFGYCFYSTARGLKDAHVLENITITEGYTKIGDHAFDGYTWLKNVNLPNSLKKIGDYAFICVKRHWSIFLSIMVWRKLAKVLSSSAIKCRLLCSLLH